MATAESPTIATSVTAERPVVGAIIPALNEEQAIGQVLRALPREWIDFAVVVDNGSTDRTCEIAERFGAQVVCEPRRGYGAAMLRGLAWIRQTRPDAEVIVFLDGDAADDPSRVGELLAPLFAGTADFVLGSRTIGRRERGALLWHSLWGNRFACLLIRLLTGARFTDLGPFRAIRRPVLESLHMCDTSFGWTAEMQVKAVRRGWRIVEIPVPYRRRIGQSKISGTVGGTLAAGVKIIWTVLRLSLARLQ